MWTSFANDDNVTGHTTIVLKGLGERKTFVPFSRLWAEAGLARALTATGDWHPRLAPETGTRDWHPRLAPKN